MRFATLLLLALLAAPASAQFGNPTTPCPTGTAEVRLPGVRVDAALFTNGNLFYGNETTSDDGYLTRFPGSADPTPLLFAANLWLGGTVQGDIRTAASRYDFFKFRPGLTGPDGVPPTPEECAVADRIWMVSRDDVASYLGGGIPTDDLLEWPVHLGAPVLDGDGIEGNYNLGAGDQPAIRGDVMAFWAMTDTAAERPDSDAPLGTDVTVEAFAFQNAQFMTETFYRLTITNRNDVPLTEAFSGVWVDPSSYKHYLASDTTAQALYYYGPDEDDETATRAYGFVAVEGPEGDPNRRDDDGDGTADEAGERLGLSSSLNYYNHMSGPTTDPNRPQEYYRALSGRWLDGTPIYEYGEGYGHPTRRITTVVYPGDPISSAFWSMPNTDGSGSTTPEGARRSSLGSGPFTLDPDASTTVTFAMVAATGPDRAAAIRPYLAKARGLRQLAAEGLLEPSRVTSVAQPVPPALTVTRPAPNPFTGATALTFTGVEGARLTVAVYDALGREVRAPLAVEADGAVEVGGGLAPGVYLVRIAGLGFEEAFPIAKVH